MAQPDQLLTRAQVAELLNLRVQTLHNHVHNGSLNLPVVRLNSRCLRYKRSDVEAFIEARRVTGAAE
jgi:excisionase family DNA binding protein